MDVREDEGNAPNGEEIGEVHSTDLANESMHDTMHDTQEEEPEVEHLNTYSIIDEEEEDDELVGYLGAMRPVEEEPEEPDDKHVV